MIVKMLKQLKNEFTKEGAAVGVVGQTFLTVQDTVSPG
jgi:hypothetical protein